MGLPLVVADSKPLAIGPPSLKPLHKKPSEISQVPKPRLQIV